MNRIQKPISRRAALRLCGLGALGAAMPLESPGQEPSTTEPMLQRSIPSTTEPLPVIGLGTWQTFDVGKSVAERAPLADVLAEFSKLGGKLIDSSPMYGESEEVAGDLAAQLGLRPKLFVATKVWTSGKQAGIRQMEESIRKLRARPLDLMQVHNLVDVATHLDTLKGWKKDGLIRYLGVTHYHEGNYGGVEKIVASGALDFLQINYSVAERESERRLLPMAKERGIAVIINRPFAGGTLFRELREKPLPGFAAEIDCTSWAQLLLKFVISHPAVTAAIPATSKVTHLRDNMGAGHGTLPDKSMRDRVAAAARA